MLYEYIQIDFCKLGYIRSMPRLQKSRLLERCVKSLVLAQLLAYSERGARWSEIYQVELELSMIKSTQQWALWQEAPSRHKSICLGALIGQQPGVFSALAG